MAPQLLDFKALSFDCYGTLIDWETGIWDALQPLMAANTAAAPNRDQVLSRFGELESDAEAATPALPYPQILRNVHQSLAASFSLKTTPALDAAFGQSIADWPAFADSAEALRFLQKHFKLVILSNVDRAGFDASQRRLGVTFDAVYTAEDVGSYKPADENFAYLIDHAAADFGLAREEILHTAQSLYHDHVPANRFGLANAWIDRQRLSGGGEWGATRAVEQAPSCDFRFYSMQEMADAVREASSD